MKKVLIYCICALMLVFAAGCETQPGMASGHEEGVSVVATIFPPYDFARAVAGDLADVRMLVDPGTEVHTYDPSPEDIITIQNADVFIYIGGENDAWVDTVLESMDTSHMTVLRMMDAVEPVEEELVEGMEVHAHEHDHASEDEHDHEDEDSHIHESEHVEFDEHIWTSPKNAALMTQAIADALCAVDADNAEAYRANADAYIAQIDEVDAQIADIVDNAATRTLVVGDRFPFRYMADEFGLEYRAAFPGCSAESEVSAATLAYLIDYVKQNNIEYVYYIEFSNKNIASSIAEQTGAELLLLHSCHNVTADEFASGVTYVSLMKQNAENLKKGLG